VYEAAETVAAVDRAQMRLFLWLVGVGRTKFKGSMRPLAVGMVDVDAEHAFEVVSVEDQQPVEALRTDCSDEALRNCVSPSALGQASSRSGCLRCGRPRRRAAVLTVAVADQEADALLREVEAKVARLLGYLGAAGITRAAGKPDASAAVGDEEQRVVAAHEHALDGEEIAGDDARRLHVEEFAPARSRAPWRRVESRPSQKTADACRRDPEAELGQLAADPPVAPARILARDL
jgi:hypothetical protein